MAKKKGYKSITKKKKISPTTKYHISKNGTPAICKAEKGNCPLGGSNEHFHNTEDAQKYADELNEERILGGQEISNYYNPAGPGYPQTTLEDLSNSKNYYARLQAITEGYENENYLKDDNPKVKRAAIENNMFVREFLDNSDEEIAELAYEDRYPDFSKRCELLFKEFVPESGAADTVGGEIVRAVNRLNYRFYNDGDIPGKNYGNETCNSSYRYLSEELWDNLDEKYKSKLPKDFDKHVSDMFDCYDEEKYKYKLLIVSNDLINLIDDNPELFNEKNTTDSTSDFIYEDDSKWDEEEYDDYYEDHCSDDFNEPGDY